MPSEEKLRAMARAFWRARDGEISPEELAILATAGALPTPRAVAPKDWINAIDRMYLLGELTFAEAARLIKTRGCSDV